VTRHAGRQLDGAVPIRRLTPTAPSPGLVLGAYPVAKRPAVVWHEGAQAVKLTHIGMPAPEGGVRGEVGVFTRASRRRLLDLVSRLDARRCKQGLFVTLTWPGSWTAEKGGDSRVWKRHLDVFLHRLRRLHPACWGIWRLEPQRRGAPHYHLLLWGAEITREWLSRAWWEVVGSGEETHLRAGTQVQVMRSHRGALAYASKYLAKLPADVGWQRPGRWWGVHQRKLAPITERRLEVLDAEWLTVARILRRLAEKGGYRLPSGRLVLATGQTARVGCRGYLSAGTMQRLLTWVRKTMADNWKWQALVGKSKAFETGRADLVVEQVHDDGEVVGVFHCRAIRDRGGAWSLRDWRRVVQRAGFGSAVEPQLGAPRGCSDQWNAIFEALEARDTKAGGGGS